MLFQFAVAFNVTNFLTFRKVLRRFRLCFIRFNFCFPLEAVNKQTEDQLIQPENLILFAFYGKRIP